MKPCIWKVKYSILEKMLINSRKWAYSDKDMKEGEKIAREVIKREINNELKRLKVFK